MRNALSLVLGAVTLSMLAGCGDASDSAGNQRAPIVIGADGDPVIGEKETVPSNPNADQTPPPPTSAGESTGMVGAALTNATPLVDLGASLEDTVTITSKDGFTGSVALAAEGLPSGVTATFTPASVDLTATAPATAKIKYTVDAMAALSTSPVAITVKATSGTQSATANANFKVNPQITMMIPLNMGALQAASPGTTFSDKWGGAAFGATPTPFKIPAGMTGVNVQFYNADSVQHVVHANGITDFGHGDQVNQVQPNTFEADPNNAAAHRIRIVHVGSKASGYSHFNQSGAGYQMQGVAQ